MRKKEPTAIEIKRQKERELFNQQNEYLNQEIVLEFSKNGRIYEKTITRKKLEYNLKHFKDFNPRQKDNVI